MLSDIISVNSNAAINPEQHQGRPQTQEFVNQHGSRFRVLTREFAAKSSMVAFWCVFWLASTILVTALLLLFLQNISPNTVFFCALFSGLIIVSFGIYHRKKLQKMLAFSIVNMTICLAVTSFFLIFSFKFISIPLSLSVLIQIALSFAYMKNKGKIVVEIILLSELIIISLKADGFLQISWAQSLVILVPFFIFLAGALIFILIYTVLLNLYYNETYKSKKLSLIFLIFNLGCSTLILSIPLSRIFLGFDLIAICILAMGLTSTNSIFLWIYSQDIALHFCLHKYEVFENEKQQKIELIPIKIPKQSLYRLSENWFGTQIKDSKMPILSKHPECLVCTQNRSDIVWLPCGHLSLCTPCCKDVIENRMISCILCKQKPTHICKVKERDETEMKLDQQMGLTDTSKSHSECVVEQYQVRIS